MAETSTAQPMPHIGERLARLETALHYEGAIRDRAISEIMWKISQLEAGKGQPTPPFIPWEGLAKIVLAILLPFLVLTITDNPQHAKEAARIVGQGLQ